MELDTHTWHEIQSQPEAQATTRESVKAQVAVSCEGQIVRGPGFRVNVAETTGAGDSFDAGSIYAKMIQHISMTDALRFAGACGALATPGLGGAAAQPTPRQVVTFLQEHDAECARASQCRNAVSRVFDTRR